MHYEQPIGLFPLTLQREHPKGQDLQLSALDMQEFSHKSLQFLHYLSKSSKYILFGQI